MTIGAYQEATPRLFVQGLFDESATALQRIGTIRELDDGRVFAYARDGGTGLSVSKLTAGAVVVADHFECVVADTAIGQTRISITLNGTTVMTANQYKDGYIQINKNTGIGHLYKIRGHKAIGAGSAGYLELYDPIRVATASSAEGTVSKHIQDGVNIHASPPIRPLTGIPPIAVTASYYFWNQVKGICACLTDNTTPVVGKTIVASKATDGSIGLPVLSEAGPNTGFDQQICGTVIQVNASAEYSLINLAIPGY
jgi:hypothetical protein